MTRWLIALICLVAATGWADERLPNAEQLLNRMRYAQALSIADQVLSSPHSEPADLVQAYRIEGLCLSAMGSQEAALRSFRKLLSIDPSFELSPDVSPKLAAPFYRAASMAKADKPIELTHQPPGPASSGVAGGEWKLRVTLGADPFGLVSAVRLRYRFGDGGESERRRDVSRPGEAAFSLLLPSPAQAVRYHFEALNRAGGVLARAASRSAPFEILPPPEPELHAEVSRAPAAERSAVELDRRVPSKEEPPSGVWSHAAFWTGVGLVGLGGVATWQAKEAGDQYNRSYGEDSDAGARSRTWAGVMYTGFLAGAGLVATGVVLWLLQPADRGPSEAGGQSFALLPTESGLTFTLTKRW